MLSLRVFVIPMTALITLLSGFILIVSTPPIWEAIYDMAVPEGGKIKPEWREDAKQISRAFWGDKNYTEVNQELGSIRLGKKETDHFTDVRDLIHLLFFPLVIGLATLAAWRWGFQQPIRWYWSLLYMSLFGITLAIWGLVAWRHMFRTLHWWIFQDDSWILPKGCASLILFPYSVWQMVGAVVIVTLFLRLGMLSVLQIIQFRKAKKTPSEAI